jgi:hypothetical protein
MHVSDPGLSRHQRAFHYEKHHDGQMERHSATGLERQPATPIGMSWLSSTAANHLHHYSSLAQTSTPTRGTRRVLRDVFLCSPGDHRLLHTFQQRLGLCQGEAKGFRLQDVTLSMGHVVHHLRDATV